MDARLRGVPRITDTMLAVATALLQVDQVTVVALQQATGRSDGQIRRVLAEMEAKGWVVRCASHVRADVPRSAHLWSYTAPGRAEANARFGGGGLGGGPR